MAVLVVWPPEPFRQGADECVTALRRGVEKVSKYPQATSSKYTWFETYYGNRLHFMPDADGTSDDAGLFWMRRCVDTGGKTSTSLCGHTGVWLAPPMAARMCMPRCAKCCKALGIPDGDGTPFNDKELRTG